MLRYWVKKEKKVVNNKKTKKKRKVKVIPLVMKTQELRHKREHKLNKPLCKNRLKLKELIKIGKRRKKRGEHNKKKKKRDKEKNNHTLSKNKS